MTRKELSQVYYLKRECSMWERKLEELMAMTEVKGQEITGMPFNNGGGVSDPVADRVARIVEMQEMIEIFRLNIEAKVWEIERYIMTLDDSLLRQIIEYRCCQLKTWDGVAAAIGYGTTSDSCRMYFNRKFPKP